MFAARAGCNLASLPKKIFISAGEYSGDLLGADLVAGLRSVFHSASFFGITGPAMNAAGVESIAGIEELSVMGVAEVVRKIGDLALLEKKIFAAIERLQPDFVITVDFPGFHFRMAEHLKMLGIPVYQYVAPKLWAWGAGRAERLRRDFSGVLGILPFEAEFFHGRGIKYRYVGCPHVDRIRRVKVDRTMFGFDRDRATQPVVLLLPGSRKGEIEAIAPLMVRIARQLEAAVPGITFALPVAANLDLKFVRAHFSGLRHLHVHHGSSLELMSVADVAVVASGTATLECGLSELPMVVVYEMGAISYALMSKLVSIKHVSLVNLIAGSEVVPEFVQNVDAIHVARQVEDLLLDQSVRGRQIAGLRLVNSSLAGGAGLTAAKTIEEWLGGVS